MGSAQSNASNDDASRGETSLPSQGAHSQSAGISSSLSPPETSPPTSSSTAIKKRNPAKEKDESGYARAQRVCRKKKRAYDACYTAQLSSKEEDCDDLFETYRTCFLRVIAKDMEKRGVNVSQDSMIGEYKAETEEDDNDR
mmetsp:Transcript_8196/g.17726  ORF Transcript_8196/g.17726 Transcript_8196/m.17726 type:complete len:141 (+) Transcript_8196:176-598(+)|eukprot:CAMPEP_0183734338 /NCGR_PEP_ID=MMETSP0737-20130205/43572_1 /TAXON_ID=385413 /ORGANISM="Thalassiosira miniscula, Strain CCMP1093" /LENGTH=140 /DNA_ID=CAMNT_0025967803 /DNA_START=139 /DNA_END=561 /DNA_ORIENTATION=+